MMYWFTADQHFNHSNIITKFVFRPFASTKDMNATIIERYNSRVSPGHTTFILGDFKVSTDGPNVHDLAAMLNGNHVFISGNHDKRNGLNTPLKFAVIKSYSRDIVLAHKPDDCNFIMGLLGIDLGFCGHVHIAWKFRKVEHGDLVNVGVDQWSYYPIDAKQIFKAYKNWIRDGRPDLTAIKSGSPDEVHVIQGGENCATVTVGTKK
jgi:calcineurin-like phosphoesterase family protein